MFQPVEALLVSLTGARGDPTCQLRSFLLYVSAMKQRDASWLSAVERVFLAEYLEEAIRLHLGELQPSTSVACEFVEVIHGQRTPTRALEFLYLRFLCEHGMRQTGDPKLLRSSITCRECGNRKAMSRILWMPGSSICKPCASERDRKRGVKTQGQTPLTQKRPKKFPPGEKVEEQRGAVELASNNELFSMKYCGEAKGTGIFVSGGFADYDYDKISPHGIRRKKRKKRR